MSISDGFMIGAVLLGPVLAVQVQKWIEHNKMKNERKLWIFRTLMATRGTPVNPDHIQALNSIDIEFSSNNRVDKKVRDAWSLYLDNLSNGPRDSTDSDFVIKFDIWATENTRLLIELLKTMGEILGYNFGTLNLKNGAYVPNSVRHQEEAQMAWQAVMINQALQINANNNVSKSPEEKTEEIIKQD